MTQVLSRRADMALSDLAANGGLLTVEQSDTFIRNVIDQPTIIRQLRTVPMAGPSREMPKIGIGSRMLRAASQSSGSRALSEADRTKPTTGNVKLETSEVIAEVRLPYEVLEDNIERGNMEQTILALIAERAALDLEELILRGDKSSADTFLKLQDGVLKRLTSHVVDGTGLGYSSDVFNNTVLALPTRFRRNRQQMRFFVPSDVEQQYRHDQSKRATGLGDSTLTGLNALPLFGSGVEAAAMLPDDVGVYTNPKNILFGIQRNIRLETDKDITAREVIIVLTSRIAINLEEELAAVKMINLGKKAIGG